MKDETNPNLFRTFESFPLAMFELGPHHPPPNPTASPSAPPAAGDGAAAEVAVAAGSKRQRRPSVRLGDLGEPPIRRPKPSKHSSSAASAAAAAGDNDHLEPLAVAFRHRRPPASSGGPPPRRPRTLRPLLADSAAATVDELGMQHQLENSDSRIRVRVSNSSRERSPSLSPADQISGGDNDSFDQDWVDQNGRCGLTETGGVRNWLSRLGLGRYSPVFDIHEVDQEVLPLLTLEDLKDMGISAVGSRRKLYCAIQELKKSLS